MASTAYQNLQLTQNARTLRSETGTTLAVTTFVDTLLEKNGTPINSYKNEVNNEEYFSDIYEIALKDAGDTAAHEMNVRGTRFDAYYCKRCERQSVSRKDFNEFEYISLCVDALLRNAGLKFHAAHVKTLLKVQRGDKTRSVLSGDIDFLATNRDNKLCVVDIKMQKTRKVHTEWMFQLAIYSMFVSYYGYGRLLDTPNTFETMSDAYIVNVWQLPTPGASLSRIKWSKVAELVNKLGTQFQEYFVPFTTNGAKLTHTESVNTQVKNEIVLIEKEVVSPTKFACVSFILNSDITHKPIEVIYNTEEWSFEMQPRFLPHYKKITKEDFMTMIKRVAVTDRTMTPGEDVSSVTLNGSFNLRFLDLRVTGSYGECSALGCDFVRFITFKQVSIAQQVVVFASSLIPATTTTQTNDTPPSKVESPSRRLFQDHFSEVHKTYLALKIKYPTAIYVLNGLKLSNQHHTLELFEFITALNKKGKWTRKDIFDNELGITTAEIQNVKENSDLVLVV
jgi:hypothetical protein